MGRKSKKDEELIMAVVNKSWQLVYNILHNQGRTREQQESVALEVVKRTAPKEIKFESSDVAPILVKIIGKE